MMKKYSIDGDLSGKVSGVTCSKVNLHKGANWYKSELKSEDDMIDIGASTQKKCF